MKKDIFLSLLEHKLTDGGMPKNYVDASISHLNEHFSKMTEEECSEYIDKLGGDDGVSEQLLGEYRKNEQMRKKAEEKKTQTAAPAEKAVPKRSVNTSAPKKPPAEKKDMRDLLAEEDETPKTHKKTEKHPDAAKPREGQPVRKPTQSAQGAKKPASTQKKTVGQHRPVQKKNGEMGAKNKALFILAVPFLVILALAIALLFVSVYATIAIAVIAFSVLLVLLTALGTAFAVIAVIYGITQMTQAGGAGLYEMGIGVIAGGITMFAGILMYNFIVRLAPFIYKKMLVLIKFTAQKMLQLYGNVKEACKSI